MVTASGQDVAVDLIETGVGAATDEPAKEGRVGIVEGPIPGPPVRVEIVGLQRLSGGRVKARPGPAVRITPQPAPGIGLEPVQLGRSDIAVIATRVVERRQALGIFNVAVFQLTP